MKVLFLDLDGTIRTTLSGNKFINEPYDQKPIEGTVQKVREYFKNDWTIIGITNQMGVLKGYKTLQDMILEQLETLKLFPEIWKIYACPDEGKTMVIIYRSANIDRPTTINIDNKLFFDEPINFGKPETFRKPETGMIDYFKQIHGPIEQALIVGDMESDELCAIKANIPFMWASDWLKSPVQ